ncbi:MAG: hypothetical protein JWN70_4018 [Planctomycetaceae bacterium]|nr:hypothetical protein [Planctomycetaceae bacterium]
MLSLDDDWLLDKLIELVEDSLLVLETDEDRLETLLPDETLEPDGELPELPELTELTELTDDPELPDEDELELPELTELAELDDPDDLLELLPLDRLELLRDDPLDADERLNDERLEKLLGTLNRVGLIGPINGIPACGSGT